MYVCMHACMYVCVYICVHYVYIYIYTYTHNHIYIYICIVYHIIQYTYIYLYIYIYILYIIVYSIHIHIYIYITYIYISYINHHIYIYIHISVSQPFHFQPAMYICMHDNRCYSTCYLDGISLCTCWMSLPHLQATCYAGWAQRSHRPFGSRPESAENPMGPMGFNAVQWGLDDDWTAWDLAGGLATHLSDGLLKTKHVDKYVLECSYILSSGSRCFQTPNSKLQTPNSLFLPPEMDRFWWISEFWGPFSCLREIPLSNPQKNMANFYGKSMRSPPLNSAPEGSGKRLWPATQGQSRWRRWCSFDPHLGWGPGRSIERWHSNWTWGIDQDYNN